MKDLEEILLEMKDTSELMVDLAYSAVFYNNKEIAQEVADLEEDVGEQLSSLQRGALEAVKGGSLTTDHGMVLLWVAQGAEVIANSALEIADLVLRDIELHPVLSAAIQESESTLTRVRLNQASTIIGKMLRESELETETGMRVVAVKRAGKWRTGLGGDFTPLADDLLIAVGPRESEPAFLAWARDGVHPSP